MLPSSFESLEGLRMSDQTDTEAQLAKLRLLVADDNAAMRGIVRTVLSAFGCMHVFEAGSAKQAFETLCREAIDVLIVDWKMQPVDGIALVRRIRADKSERMAYMPIIMLTAYAEPTKVREARDAGVSEFLVKPFCSEGLYRRLVSIVNRPRPFVRTKHFFGPDRRRLEVGFEGDERRQEAPIA
jgi:two-component system chemotaxis response regulator CheY